MTEEASFTVHEEKKSFTAFFLDTSVYGTSQLQQNTQLLLLLFAWKQHCHLSIIYSFFIAYPVKREQLQSFVHITLSYTGFIYLFYLSFFTCCKPQLDTVNGQGYFSAQRHCLIYQDNISKQNRLATQIRSS